MAGYLTAEDAKDAEPGLEATGKAGLWPLAVGHVAKATKGRLGTPIAWRSRRAARADSLCSRLPKGPQFAYGLLDADTSPLRTVWGVMARAHCSRRARKRKKTWSFFARHTTAK